MGLPLPPSTLFKVQHSQWPDEDDWSKLTPQAIMARQWNAYAGLFKHPLRKTDAREPDHNVIVNLCEPIVSTGIDFLLGRGVTFEVMQPGAGIGADPASPDLPDLNAQAYLDATFKAQPLGKLPTLAADEINSGVFGHHFLNLVPDDPDSAPYPGLAVLNPHQMRIETAPNDYRKVVNYEFRFYDLNEQGDDVERRKLVMRDKESGGWTIIEQERSAGASIQPEVRVSLDPNAGWTDLEGSPLSWPYPWPPIHDGPNMVQPNIYWGKADLRLDLIHLNDVINFVLSNMNRIGYFYAHPRDIFFGVRGSDIEVAPNESMTVGNVNAKVVRLQMQGDLAVLGNQVDRLMDHLDTESHVPALALGRLRGYPAVPSGVALRIELNALVQQTYQKRELREVFYTKLCQHILELGGYGTDRKIVIHWPEMLPIDSLVEAQSATLWHGLGVSRATLQEKGEFDPKVEAEKRAAEDAADAQQQQNQQAGEPTAPLPTLSELGQAHANGTQNGSMNPAVGSPTAPSALGPAALAGLPASVTQDERAGGSGG